MTIIYFNGEREGNKPLYGQQISIARLSLDTYLIAITNRTMMIVIMK